MSNFEERERARKAEKDKEKEEMYELLARTIMRTLKRRERIRDPVARHLITLENLATIADGATAFLDGAMANNNMSDKVRANMQECSEKIGEHIGELMDWVQQPVYSPEHPFGATVMKEAEDDFEQLQNV